MTGTAKENENETETGIGTETGKEKGIGIVKTAIGTTNEETVIETTEDEMNDGTTVGMTDVDLAPVLESAKNAIAHNQLPQRVRLQPSRNLKQ